MPESTPEGRRRRLETPPAGTGGGDKPYTAPARRRLLQILPLGAGAVWSRPAAQTVLLPAHAQITQTDTTNRPAVTGDFDGCRHLPDATLSGGPGRPVAAALTPTADCGVSACLILDTLTPPHPDTALAFSFNAAAGAVQYQALGAGWNYVPGDRAPAPSA